jgi:hypothetical protein
MIVNCLQCEQPFDYNGVHPEFFAVCNTCRQMNMENRQARPVGRPSGPITYPVGQRLPNSDLTPISYESKPPTYECVCGRHCQFIRTHVENGQRKTCGHCRREACLFCKNRSITNKLYKTHYICLDCLIELQRLAIEAQNDGL